MLNFTDYFLQNTEPLTDDHKGHLRRIITKTVERMITKYVAGAVEHGGDLWDKDCLKESFDEAIDQMTYIQTEIIKRSQ
jgi:hypothetical protein